MTTLPTPIVHVDTVNIHWTPDQGTQSLAASLSEAVDILKTDDYITGIAEEIVADQRAAQFFRDELLAALVLAGIEVSHTDSDQDLVGKVASAVVAAKLHKDSLDRVTAVTNRFEGYTGPGELAYDVAAAIRPPAPVESVESATAQVPAVATLDDLFHEGAGGNR